MTYVLMSLKSNISRTVTISIVQQKTRGNCNTDIRRPKEIAKYDLPILRKEKRNRNTIHNDTNAMLRKILYRIGCWKNFSQKRLETIRIWVYDHYRECYRQKLLAAKKTIKKGATCQFLLIFRKRELNFLGNQVRKLGLDNVIFTGYNESNVCRRES